VGFNRLTPPTDLALQSVKQNGKRCNPKVFNDPARRSRCPKRTFYFSLQNLGTDPDAFKIKGTADVPGVFYVRYFLGSRNFGGITNEITAAVTAGNYTTATLAPKTITGNATWIRAEVTLDPLATQGTTDIVITATSASNAFKTDLARAQVILRR
jgi:hypothetical protein